MMCSRGGDLQRTLGIWLTVDVRKVDERRWSCGRWRGGQRCLDRHPQLPVGFELSQVVDAHYRGRGGDPRLGHVADGHVETPHPEPIEVGNDRQGAADGSERAVEGQLAQPGGVAGQAALFARVDDGRRHCQVEATPLFGQLRRSEVDGDLATWELKATVVDGDLHPFAGLLQRTIAESHDVEPGEAVGNVSLHLHPDTVEAEDRPGPGPGQHQRRYYTNLCIGVSQGYRDSPGSSYARG